MTSLCVGTQQLKVFEKGKEIIQILLEAGFAIKKSKVKGPAREIQFLGVKWQDGRRQIPTDVINKITAMSPPINRKETQAFLGAIGFWRMHIPEYSQIVNPLYLVTRKKNDFPWGPEQQQAFAQIKQEIAHAVALGPVRTGPDVMNVLYSAARSHGLSWSLWQKVSGMNRKWKAAVWSPTRQVAQATEGESGSSQLAELKAVQLALDIAEREKWPKLYLYTDSWMVANALWGWLKRWKEANWQRGGKPVWAAEEWKDIATRVGRLPVKVRHVDAHIPKSRANEEHQNNEQVDPAAKIEVSKIDLDWEHKGELFLARWGHDASGHQGRDATYKWARDRGVDLTMDSISQVIHDCGTCAAIKQAKRVKPLWYGGRWSKYKYGEAWQIDYITLPQTCHSKCYMITMVEATMEWLETTVPYATARNTILGLEKQVLWRHGTPKRTESDNGTHFKNSLINTWAREHGIEWNRAASTVMSQRWEPWSCQHGDVAERNGGATPCPAPRVLAAPGGDTKAELGGRQQDPGVQAPALHRQAKSGRLGIFGSGVKKLLELQPPRSCEHCSDGRGHGKGPGPGLGLGWWPREQMNLQLVGQRLEEQGQWWLGEPLGEGNVLTRLGGKVNWDVGMDLFPGRVVRPWARVGRKAASGLEWLEVCMACFAGDLVA
ncbi:hypothetical protein DUI87_28516 [Hirundo rustica rustica]|uniref:Uncharacterized protein n=1 Tax=Hirundo rustica rustica TaxID=333673 RepID=A0A3M0J7W5_HIRRU|nr:hypothetical protein DUI87_28516 [Hirundo rustica rustica]